MPEVAFSVLMARQPVTVFLSTLERFVQPDGGVLAGSLSMASQAMTAPPVPDAGVHAGDGAAVAVSLESPLVPTTESIGEAWLYLPLATLITAAVHRSAALGVTVIVPADADPDPIQ